MNAILVVNMNYLGDALMTTPAVRALKLNFPDARIDVIAGSASNYGALEILAMDPDIDRLIPRAQGGSIARGKQLFLTIKSDNYDLVVVLPSLPYYSLIAKLAGARVLTVPKADEIKHMADHMLDTVAQFLKIDSGVKRSFVMKVPVEGEQYASSALGCLDKQRLLVLFNVGASRPQKRWPAGHFGSAARLALGAGLNIAFVGGDNEQDLATAAHAMSSISEMSCPGKALNLVGQTTLIELAAIIQDSALVVTCDTGAMHIACALNIPVVALFGSTKPGFTGPYGEGRTTVVHDLGLSCAPCGTHPTCNGRYECMSGIRPEDVMESILNILKVPEEIVVCVKS